MDRQDSKQTRPNDECQVEEDEPGLLETLRSEIKYTVITLTVKVCNYVSFHFETNPRDVFVVSALRTLCFVYVFLKHMFLGPQQLTPAEHLGFRFPHHHAHRRPAFTKVTHI